jgi:hypothetical protein
MREVATAIFWKLHSAFLRNERDRAHVLLGMFGNEVGKSDLSTIIGPHVKRYEWMRLSIESGTFARFHGEPCGVPTYHAPAAEDDQREADFNRTVVRERVKLFNCLGIQPKSGMLAEFEMGEFGRCDFVVREGRMWHAIESKIGEAGFASVAQIDKYRIALELDMCLGMYDRVEAAVLARGFSPYVSSELSRHGVRMVAHDGTLDRLRWLNGQP